MASRDVEMIFRAKDQATAVFEAITNGLRKVNAEQSGVQTEAKETGGALVQLGADLQKVRNVLGSLGARQNLERDLSGARDSISRLETALRESKGELARYGNEITEAAAESAKLRTEADALSGTIDRQVGSIARTKAELNALNAATKKADRSDESYLSGVEKLTGKLSQQQAELRRLQQEYRGKNKAVKVSVAHEKALREASESTSASIERQIATLKKAEGSYRGIRTQAEQIDDALVQLEARMRGPLLKAFGEQRKVLKDTTALFQQQSAEAQRLYRLTKTASDPSPELRKALLETRKAAESGRAAVRAQTEEYAKLRRILRETGGDLAEFENRQARAAAVLDRGRAVSRTYADATQKAAKANRDLAQSQSVAAAVSGRAARGSERATVAVRKQAVATDGLRNAMRGFLGGSRQSLSFFQRLRGELLALAASYAGLFAAFQGIRGVIEASRELQGVTNRLAAVFQGDQFRVTQELDFLRRTANRLGIEFGVLAAEYSKFAVASQGTNLAGEATRKIFLAVAQAARVQQLSIDQIEGTFLALTQITSKSAVTMEELRRQLGDRLPGAIQIMAQALDRTVPELIKLVETGSLSSDVLSEFADELDRRFAGQLDASLNTVSASLGRFSNQVFQTQIAIGDAGALRGLTDLFDRLARTLSSEDFAGTIEAIGSAIGALSGVVALAAENIRVLFAVFAGFLATRFIPIFTALIAKVAAFKAALVAGSGVAAAFAAAFSPVFIAVGTLSIALAYLATEASRSTKAMRSHRESLDDVRDALEKAKREGKDFSDVIASRTVVEARQNLEKLQASTADVATTFARTVNRLTRDYQAIHGAISPALGDLRETLRAFIAEEEDIDALRSAFDSFIESLGDGDEELRDTAVAAAEALTKMEGFTEAVNVAKDIVLAFSDNAKVAAAAQRRLANEVSKFGAGATQQQKATEKYLRTVSELEKLVPSLNAAMERAGRIRSFEQLANRARKLGEDLNIPSDHLDKILTTLRAIEANAHVLGNLSGPAALATRMLQVIDQVPVDVAEQRIHEVGESIREQLGKEWLRAFDDNQQAVLRIVAHMFGGKLPTLFAERLVTALKTGSEKEVFEVFKDVSLVLPASLVTAFEQGTVSIQGYVEAMQEGRDETERTEEAARKLAETEAERAAKRREQQRAASAETLRQLAIENGLNEARQAGFAREAHIAAAILELHKQDEKLTANEVKLVTELAGKQFDLAQAARDESEQRKAIVAAERRINDLMQLRTLQQTELNALVRDNLDPARQEELRRSIEALDDKILTSLDAVLAMAEGLKDVGLEMESIIQRLRNLKLRTDDANSALQITKRNIEDAFKGRAVEAADDFINRLSEGRNVFKSLGASLKQFVGQFLRDVARMIARAIALRAAMSFLNATGLGGIAAFLPSFDAGGIVGSRGRPIRLPSTGAGGRAHLAIVHEGEEVLSRDNPRNALNGGPQVVINDYAGVQVDAQVRDDGAVEVTIDKMVSQAALFGSDTGRALASLGAVPALEAR